MLKLATIAVGAGVASAVLFIISATASLLAMVLAYLTPLPIMIAALGFRQSTGALAAMVAASVIGTAIGPAAGGSYLAVLGLPAWWLAYLALLARPSPAGAAEWYPVSRLVLWIAALAAGPVLAIGVFLVVRSGGLDPLVASLATRLRSSLGEMRLPGGLDYDDLIRIAPVAISASTFLMLAINLWLAGRVVLTSQRLPRPWPASLADGLRLPRRTGLLFVVLVGVAFLPDPFGLAAAVAAAALAMAFVLEGLAAAHVVTRGLAARRLILTGIYATVLFLLPWPLLALVVLGCLDSVFSMRGRPQNPPPSPPPPNPHRS